MNCMLLYSLVKLYVIIFLLFISGAECFDTLHPLITALGVMQLRRKKCRIYSVSKKKVAPLKLFTIFSLLVNLCN